MAFGLGENVGRAFVKLYADGGDVPDNIKDALDDLDPIMKEAAERHADKYQESFADQFEKDSYDNRERLHEAIQNGAGRMDAIGEQMGTDLFDGLQLQLDRELGDSDLAAHIRKSLEEDFAMNGSWDRLESRLSDLNREAIIGQRELDRLAAQAKRVAEQDIAKQHSIDMKALEAEIKKTIQDTDNLADSTEKWGKQGRIAAEDVKNHMRELGTEIDTGTEHISEWVRQINGAHTEEEKWSTGFRSRLHNLNVELDKSASLTGKIFGKGSRNDFFNLLGSAVEGTVRLTHIAPNLIEKLLGGGEGAGGAGGFASVMKAAGSSIAGLAVAIGAVILALGPIAALVSGLSAAVIGLVASLAFAAAGIIAVAGVLLVPLAAAIGVVVGALIGMDDQTRKTINHAINPLLDKLKNLGDAAGEAFGPKLVTAINNLGPVFDGLEPIVRGIGRALGDVTISWSEMLSGPGFLAFRDAFGKFIPDALRRIGDIAGHTLGGIGGILRAAIPITREFLKWLDGITERFSDWANSKSGQQQLKHFFDEAADSAKAVWHFVSELSKSIFELFNQGKGSGDTIFTELGDKIQHFVEWLKDPSNRDSIKDFFENGIDVAEDIGNLILDIGDFIDKLDNKRSRKTLHDIFAIVSSIIEAVEWLIDKYDQAASKVHKLKQFMYDFGEAVVWAAQETGAMVLAIVKAPEKAIDALTSAIGKIPWGKMASGARDALGDVLGAAKRVGNSIIEGFQHAADVVGNAMGDIYDDVKGLPGKIVGLFSGLAGKILSAIGSIDIGSLLHIPDPGGGVPFIPGMASGGVGGVTSRASLRWVGEAGPEAVVPLNRPLGQVDPSVRGLSAIAQGLAGRGKTVDASGWTIVTQGPDPYTVAREVVNDFAAKALF